MCFRKKSEDRANENERMFCDSPQTANECKEKEFLEDKNVSEKEGKGKRVGQVCGIEKV